MRTHYGLADIARAQAMLKVAQTCIGEAVDVLGELTFRDCSREDYDAMMDLEGLAEESRKTLDRIFANYGKQLAVTAKPQERVMDLDLFQAEFTKMNDGRYGVATNREVVDLYEHGRPIASFDEEGNLSRNLTQCLEFVKQRIEQL